MRGRLCSCHPEFISGSIPYIYGSRIGVRDDSEKILDSSVESFIDNKKSQEVSDRFEALLSVSRVDHENLFFPETLCHWGHLPSFIRPPIHRYQPVYPFSSTSNSY